MAIYSFLPLTPCFSDIVHPTFSVSLSFGGVLLLSYWMYTLISRHLNPLRKLPYPPTPPPRDFILGHARDLLSKPLWLKLADLATTYGPVMHLKALDTHFVVLNSVHDAIELLDKRSNNSDRPYFPMLDLGGGTFSTAFKPYGPMWHAHRRLFQQTFNPRASLEYRPTQVEKVNDMLYSFLDSPTDFLTHIQTLSVAVIMATMYGYNVLPKDDPFQEIAEDAMKGLTESANPDASIVNVLPFLRFLPTWFPGASFHHVARVVKEKVVRLQEVPYKYAQENLAAGTASPSLVANLLETCELEEDRRILKEFAATGYGAGADTTSSAIGTFVYAMAMYPDIQKKAQEELDRVVGTDRLARYEDEVSLPYIQAIYREVLRWRPVAPLGILHASMEEDVYNGYYIPKGTTLVSNLWGMSRDPVLYKNPEEFNPDRFFDENNELSSDDVSYIFGFGRRICPGRHMAAATIWLAIVTILSAFDIKPAKDDSGQDIPLNVQYSDALISHPLPFKCSITPRSIQAKQLIVDIRNNSTRQYFPST